MPKTESDDTTRPSPLTSAVKRLLRPLVGLLLENGLTYPWLSALLKSLFVEVAEKEFRLPDKRQTDSRIALLTGVHRKDIRRLRGSQHQHPGNEDPPASVYLGAHLVAIWTSDERFVDSDGHPKALPRLAADGVVSFEELVTSVNKDIRPRSVLDEWLRLGAVELDSEDRVRLKTEAFIPEKGFEEKAYYLGGNVHDHIAAARHNMGTREPPMLERSVYYDDLSPDSVQVLNELAHEEGMRTLTILNKRARKLQEGDKDATNAVHRIKLGIYFYHGRQEDADDPRDD